MLIHTTHGVCDPPFVDHILGKISSEIHLPTSSLCTSDSSGRGSWVPGAFGDLLTSAKVAKFSWGEPARTAPWHQELGYQVSHGLTAG